MVKLLRRRRSKIPKGGRRAKPKGYGHKPIPKNLPESLKSVWDTKVSTQENMKRLGVSQDYKREGEFRETVQTNPFENSHRKKLKQIEEYAGEADYAEDVGREGTNLSVDLKKSFRKKANITKFMQTYQPKKKMKDERQKMKVDEQLYWLKCMEKHKDNYSKMAMDNKTNWKQYTERECEKRCSLILEEWDETDQVLEHIETHE